MVRPTEGAESGTTDPGGDLTLWQQGRRRRRHAYDRMISILFGLVALFFFSYVVGLVELALPAFTR